MRQKYHLDKYSFPFSDWVILSQSQIATAFFFYCTPLQGMLDSVSQFQTCHSCSRFLDNTMLWKKQGQIQKTHCPNWWWTNMLCLMRSARAYSSAGFESQLWRYFRKKCLADLLTHYYTIAKIGTKACFAVEKAAETGINPYVLRKPEKKDNAQVVVGCLQRIEKYRFFAILYAFGPLQTAYLNYTENMRRKQIIWSFTITAYLPVNYPERGKDNTRKKANCWIFTPYTPVSTMQWRHLQTLHRRYSYVIRVIIALSYFVWLFLHMHLTSLSQRTFSSSKRKNVPPCHVIFARQNRRLLKRSNGFEKM